MHKKFSHFQYCPSGQHLTVYHYLIYFPVKVAPFHNSVMPWFCHFTFGPLTFLRCINKLRK